MPPTSAEFASLPPVHLPLALRVAALVRALPEFRGQDRITSRLLRSRSCYPNEERVVEFGGGLRVLGNPSENPYLASMAMMRHAEPALAPVLAANLDPGDGFADVGGLAGLYALWGARLVGPSGEVHCFEPVPWSVEAIRRNARLNGFEHVTVHECAVGDRAETLSLFLHPQHLGVASGYRHGSEIGFEEQEIRVEALPLDHAFEGRRSPALVKIDVEGMEARVLRGARELLRRPDAPALVFETGDEQRAGTTFGEIVGWLEDEVGFQTFALTPSGLARESREQAGATTMNVFAANPGIARHRERVERLSRMRFARNQND